MSELRNRVVTGGALAGAFALLLLLAGWIVQVKLVLIYLLAAGSILATYEYYKNFVVKGEFSSLIGAALRGGIIVLCILCFVSTYTVLGVLSADHLLAVIGVGVLALLTLTICEGRNELLTAQREFALLVPAVLLLLVGCSSLIFILSIQSFGPRLVFWLAAVVCVNDIGAYFVGKELGRVRLAPAISPNKTVLGSVAGFVCGTILGGVLAPILMLPGGVVGGATLALVVTFASQLGDLVKSFAKRTFGIKDFGTLLPGHGGVIDRADGILMAAPIMVIFYLAI